MRDGWCPWVPGETTETRTQVKITLYGNFIVGICGFTCFLQHKSPPPPIQDFRHWEPAGFFTGFPRVPSVHPNLCYTLYVSFPDIQQMNIYSIGWILEILISPDASEDITHVLLISVAFRG